MEYTAIAQWLNTTFAGYDSAILGFMNSLAGKLGVVLTPLMKVITFLGEKGIVFFLLALCFMCFSKTRRMGVCMFGAVCCGALITNIILKDMVARPRPFEYMAVYKSYWDYVGSPAESGFSFPSGHVTAVAAGMGSLCFTKGKKMILPAVVVVLLMAMSRNYLMAHFPSDVLFAAIIGAFSALIAYLITRAIFIYLEDNDDFPFCATLLDFDLPVRLPDREALTSFVNHAGKSAPKSARRSEREQSETRSGGTARRAKDGAHSAKAPRAAAATKDDSTEGAFSGALRFAAAAGNELLGKNGAKRSSEGEARATRKSASASDWSSRWDSYRSAKDGAKRSNAPAGEFTTRFAADQYTQEEPPRTSRRAAEEIDASMFVDEDADMKIVPERTSKSASFDWNDEVDDVDVSASVSDDGIDWASLGLGELASDDYGLDAEFDEPVIRRRDRA